MRARHGVGHGVDSELGGLGRRRACQSGGWSTRNCALDQPRHISAHADLWICGQRKRVAHRPTGSKNKSKRQFDCFGSTAVRPGPSQPRPSARAAATPIAAFGIYAGRRSQGVILNDEKSSTYKLALLRATARVADATPALAVSNLEEDTVDLPLGIVALNWVRMYLPLVAAGLPQMPGNSGPDGLSFAKAGFRQLSALNITGQDLRVGSSFTGERAVAVARALAEARRTIADMPANYIR
jgi:hypothetical protein